MRPRPTVLALATCVALAATACGSTPTTGTAASPASTSTGAASPSRQSSNLRGTLTIFAAASLTAAFNGTKSRLDAEHPGLSVTNSFAGSQQLVAQIQAGAPADVVATADTETMGELRRAALVDTPRVFAHNQLEIVVAPGDPRHVRSLADLARPGLKVVLADSSVPVGKFAREALAKAHVTVHPVSAPLDVAATLRTVELGDADAAIVYVTDVRAAGAQVSGVQIPAQYNVMATYPIAVVRTTGNRAAAAAFVEEIVSGVGHEQLASRGFSGP